MSRFSALPNLRAKRSKLCSAGRAATTFRRLSEYLFAGATRWLGAVPSAGFLGRVEKSLPANKSRLRIAIRALAENSLRNGYAVVRTLHYGRAHPVIDRPPAAACRALSRGRGDALRGCSMRIPSCGSQTICSSAVTECQWPRRWKVVRLFSITVWWNLRLALPSSFKVRRLTTKWVLKQVARRYLPGDASRATEGQIQGSTGQMVSTRPARHRI